MKSNLDPSLEKDSLKIIGIIGMMIVVMTFVILVMTERIIDDQKRLIIEQKMVTVSALAGRFENRLEDSARVVQLAAGSPEFVGIPYPHSPTTEFMGIPPQLE